VFGDPNPDLLTGIDPARVPGVSSGTARRLLGTDDVDALWNVYAPILRLDAADPVQAWRDHIVRLRTRAEALNARGFDTLRFQGPGTDLTVGVMRGAVWLAAGFETTWGREMIANMPTEEVFTTPDNRVVAAHRSCVCER
jgi:aminopeptidase